jgi:predicted nucleotidyltransferase
MPSRRAGCTLFSTMQPTRSSSTADLRERIALHRAAILRIAEARGAVDIRVFGSVARGDDTPASDIDFLVRLAEGRDIVDLAGLRLDLAELLDADVDVSTPTMLRPEILELVEAEARAL